MCFDVNIIVENCYFNIGEISVKFFEFMVDLWKGEIGYYWNFNKIDKNKIDKIEFLLECVRRKGINLIG